MITITEPVKGERLRMVDEIKRALEIAETTPFRYLIQHIGVAGEEYDDRKVDAAFSSLEQINLFAHQRGVEVLLENTPNQLSTAERLVHFLDLTHLKLGFCFDAGHAHMNEGIETAYNIMKSRIWSTHLHDNDGTSDQHRFPFADGNDLKNTIDWKKTMDVLRAAPDQYPLLLELHDTTDFAHALEDIKEIFEKLESL